MVKKNHYPFLDFFRGAAVLWVISHHIFIFFDMQIFLRNWTPLCDMIGKAGILGVDMFFVISGFLITGILLEGAERVDVARFYVRRFFKIIPQYAAVLCVGILLNVLLNHSFGEDYKILHEEDVQISPYFYFFQSYAKQIPILAHTWSLAIEEHFYFVYPWLLFLLWRLRNRNPLDDPAPAVWMCVLFMAAGNVLRYLSAPTQYQLFSFNSPMPHQTTLLRFDALFMGCMLKFLEPKIIRTGRSASRIWAYTSLALAAVMYVLLIMSDHHDYWIYYTAAYIAPALLIFSCLKGLTVFDRPGVISWIGKNSYGIYLWHYIVLFPLLILFIYFKAIWVVFLFVAAAILAGAVSTMTIERYFLNLRQKIAP